MTEKPLKIIAIITARKGSKGLKSKNSKIIAGKPLISWTIEEALKSKYITKLYISTDCKEILRIAKDYSLQCDELRPNKLSRDNSLSVDVIDYELKKFKDYDIVCMLQPTSPLRTVIDIDKAIEKLIKYNANTLVSVTKNTHPPFWSFTVNKEKLESLFEVKDINKRRQELPVTYKLNGAIYLAKISFFKESKTFLDTNTFCYIMPENSSIDIDNLNDFELAEKELTKENS